MIKKSSRRIDFDADSNGLEGYSISELGKIADHWFRKWLLSKAKRDSSGWIYCHLTQKYYPADKIHVCHYIPRACTMLRYSEDNCILCASSSNVYDNLTGKHIQDFEKFLGKDKVNELNDIKKRYYEEVTRENREDYISTIIKLRDELNKI